MKSIATLAGWIVIGVVLAFAGQRVWDAYRTKSPESAKEVEAQVNETMDKGQAIAEEVVLNAAEKTVDTLKRDTAEPASEETAEPAPASTTEDVDLAPEPQPEVANAEIPGDTAGEKDVNERLLHIAEGDNAKKHEARKSKVVYTEQEKLEEKKRQRQEEILLQRQVRIVDDLLDEEEE